MSAAVSMPAPAVARARRKKVAAAGVMLAIAIVAGGWLRVAPIAERPLWYDEAYTWFAADPGTWQAWLHWQSRDAKHPPLSFMVVSATMKLLDSEEPWAVRLPAVVCGILLIPATFVLGAVVFGPLAGGAAALLVAFAPDLVDQGQQARMYPMFALVETLALALAIRLLDFEREGRRRAGAGLGAVVTPAAASFGWPSSFAGAWERAGRTSALAARRAAAAKTGALAAPPSRWRDAWREAFDWWRWVALGLLLAVALWTNQLALAIWAGLPAGIVAAALVDPALRDRETWSRLAARLAVALFVAILACHVGLAAIVDDLVSGTHVHEGEGVALGEIARSIQAIAVQIAGGSLGAVVAYPLAAFGLLVLLRRRPAAGVVLAVVGAAGVVILFPMRQRHPFMAPRFLTAAEPVLWICIATAAGAAFSTTAGATAAAMRHRVFASAPRRDARRSLGWLPPAATAVVLAICAYRSADVLGWIMPDRYHLPHATIEVVKRVEPGDFVAFHPEFNRTVGHYYGLPANHPLHAALYKDPNVARPETLAVTARPKRLWLVGSFSSTNGRGERWYAEQRNQIEAFARWYGHPELGKEAAASIRPGDTYIARFDSQTVTLEFTHRQPS